MFKSTIYFRPNTKKRIYSSLVNLNRNESKRTKCGRVCALFIAKYLFQLLTYIQKNYILNTNWELLTEANKSLTWKTKNLLLSLLCVLLHFKHTHIGYDQPQSGLEEEILPGSPRRNIGWRREYSARFCVLQSLYEKTQLLF